MKKLLLFVFLFGSCIAAHSQVKQIPYLTKSDSPEWMKLMYGENSNVKAVRIAYETYYDSHPFVKNEHTQFYKRWMRENMHRTDADGNILQKDFKAADLAWAQTKSQNPPGSPWEEQGPWQYDHEQALEFYIQSPGSAHIYTVEQSLSNPQRIYAGTATAGIWRSDDKGLHWDLISRDLFINSVYSIAIDPFNEDIVYCEGAGQIWKTTDGGNNWSLTGDATFQSADRWVRDLKVSPSASNIVFAATNNGLFRSVNSGSTWIQMLPGEFMEIEFKPDNPATIYTVKVNGSGTEFYRSANSGTSWVQISTGWPSPIAGDEQLRCEISVTPANPNRIYVLASGYADGYGGLYGIYVSDNAGASFYYQCCGTGPGGVPTPLTNPNILGWSEDGSGDGGQYYYDLALGASPNDQNRVFAAGIDVWRSLDAGANWEINAHWVTWVNANTPDRYTHADVHDIKYFWNGVSYDMWVASDGGLYYSADDGDHMEPRMYGIQGTDFWGFQAGFQNGDAMLGGTYHNGTIIKYNDIYKYGADSEESGGWLAEGAGDNIRGFVNPGDNDLAYDDGGAFRFSPVREVRPANEAFDGNYRCNTFYWTGEYGNYEWHPNCYNILYSPVGNELHKSENGGLTWELVKTFAGEKVIQVLQAPSDPNYIYVTVANGYWDHTVYRSTNAGITFTQINPSSGVTGGHQWRHKYLAVDSYDPDKIWCILIGGQTGYKVFKSTNGGFAWSDYSGSNLDNEEIMSISHQLGTDEGLYAGTRHGVFYRNASMSEWEAYSTDLPASTNCAFLQPWYGEEKIRTAGNRGVFQCDFYESSQPIARVSADKLSMNIGVSCEDQTIQFADYSIMKVNENSTWEWTFEGGIPSTSSDRNPVIQYITAGTFDVSLSITDDNGSHSVVMTDFITITNDMATLPFSEDFEGDFPPQDWKLFNPGTSAWEQDWMPEDEANNKVACYPNWWVNSTGFRTMLILPAMDFSSASDPTFSFDYTYRKYGGYLDSIAISVRTESDYNWTRIWQRGGDNLNVAGTDMFWWDNAGSNIEWVNIVDIDMSMLTGESCVEIAIENIGGWGNHVWIDNIFIDGDCLGDLNNDGEISVADLLILLGDFNCSGICVADLNNDDIVSTADLLILLSIFGSDCN